MKNKEQTNACYGCFGAANGIVMSAINVCSSWVVVAEVSC